MNGPMGVSVKHDYGSNNKAVFVLHVDVHECPFIT